MCGRQTTRNVAHILFIIVVEAVFFLDILCQSSEAIIMSQSTVVWTIVKY